MTLLTVLSRLRTNNPTGLGATLTVEGDQAAVDDGNAMGVARQIGQHRLGSAEWALCIDDPLGLAQRRQMGREGLRVGKRGRIAEEVEAVGSVRRHELRVWIAP